MRMPRLLPARFPRLPTLPGFARWLLVLVCVSALTVGAAAAPRWLRRADAFRVRHVQVVGARYLDPHDVLAASGIGPRNSVFDDPAPWRARLVRLPLVADAAIERRLPTTLVIRVTEAEPVALVPTPELVPITAAGLVLPIRPGSADLDLPVLDVEARVGADGRVASPDALRLAGALASIAALEPELARAVSEAQPGPAGSVRLLLREPATLEALVPAQPDAATLRHVRGALADVSARGELGRLRRLDARFTDQIVIAFNTERR